MTYTLRGYSDNGTKVHHYEATTVAECFRMANKWVDAGDAEPEGIYDANNELMYVIRNIKNG